MQALQDTDAAIASCRAALALDEYSADAHLQLGCLLCERDSSTGELVLAQQHLTTGLEYKPHDRQGW